MNEPRPASDPGSTSQLATILDRVRAGDAAAVNDLLARVEDRMRALARRMLRKYPAVRPWEQTDDIFQMAALRLARSLRSVEVADPKHFLRLAALQIRRVLLTLAERYRGQLQAGPGTSDGSSSPAAQVPELTSGPDELACWTEFHTAVGQLPEELCEVVDLLFYQGLTQEEAAETLGVTDRTVRSRWRRARLDLIEKLGGRLPGS
jgi:RNA polymerase sigma factor (sigma-70 family)